MYLDVSVSLFKSSVFFDVVQVVSSNYDGSLHLCGDDQTFEDSSSDGRSSSEWAFVVDEISFNGFLWNFKAYKLLILNMADYA